ncbi:hypothetical protein TB2_005088 [Malus domestica]|uniref:Uncharacterized protein n=1 Tax=Malus domestica TaxID=3750 RepID=A0A498IWV3_MALDO|nr:hypothetical protein DVH24_016986 [Malus domestica]
MIVKPGPAQDLLMQNQNFKRHSSSQGGQRQGQFQRAMRGRAPIAAPRAAQLAQGGGHGGDRGGPTRGRGRQRRQHGQRRGRSSPVVDLMKEIYNQDELSYIHTFDLDHYSSVETFVQDVLSVDDEDHHKGVSPIHEVLFVMRQGQGRYRLNTLMRVEDARREGWLAVRDRLQCVQALYRQNVVGNVQFEIDGANYVYYPRRKFESLEHLDNCILELPGNNQDGHIGQEDYVMHASNNGLTVYTREAFVDYDETRGWLRAVTRLHCVRKMVD